MHRVLKKTLIVMAFALVVVLAFSLVMTPSYAAKKLKIKGWSNVWFAGEVHQLKSNYKKGVTWKSSKPSVIKVNKKTGRAIAKKAGKAKITAKYKKQKATRMYYVEVFDDDDDNTEEHIKDLASELSNYGDITRTSNHSGVTVNTVISYDESEDNLVFESNLEYEDYSSTITMTIPVNDYNIAHAEYRGGMSGMHLAANLNFNTSSYTRGKTYHWNDVGTYQTEMDRFAKSHGYTNKFANADFKVAISSWEVDLNARGSWPLEDIGFDNY